MGNQANELSLGCDCLGQIHYFVRSFFRSFYLATDLVVSVNL